MKLIFGKNDFSIKKKMNSFLKDTFKNDLNIKIEFMDSMCEN